MQDTVPVMDVFRKELVTNMAGWIKTDSERSLERLRGASPAMSASARNHMFEMELPKAWDQYRQYRNIVMYEDGLQKHRIDDDLHRKTAAYALRTASIARSAFVLTGMAQDAGYDRATAIADAELDKHVIRLQKGHRALPAFRTMELPIRDALSTYENNDVFAKPHATMLGTVGLAATACIEYGPRHGSNYLMPPHGMV